MSSKRCISALLMLGSVLLLLGACSTAPYTGRKQFILTTEAEEGQLGLQAWQEIKSGTRASTNRAMSDMVARCGQRIAAVANRPDYNWEFSVIADPQANAFALPGGKVAFYEGILPICRDETGIAVVMGHEVGHAIARHGGERITRGMVTQFGVDAASSMLGGDDPRTREIVATGLGVGAQVSLILPFSRKHESEADRIGLILMAKAGYDPRAAPEFWKRMAAMAEGGRTFEFLSTHPHAETRVAQLEAWMPEALEHYEASRR